MSAAIAQSATSAERIMALLRVGVSLLAFAGFALNATAVSPATVPQAALEIAVVLVASSFSTWVLYTTRRRVLPQPVLLFSVCVDAGIATVALASNWFASPVQHAGGLVFYAGALSSLDIAIFPLTLMTSVLRLSRAAVLVSAAATTAGLALVVGVDHHLGFPMRLDKLILLGVYQLASIASALLVTHWFVSALHGTSSASERAERARNGLLALLTDHHDLRSSICDVRMNAERLHEELTLPGRSPRGPEVTLSQSVTHGLLRMTDVLHTTSDRVLRVLDGSGDLQPTDVERATRAAVNAFNEQWPQVSVELRSEKHVPSALFGGGEDALAKLVTSLLMNAAEGNGAGRASHVVIETRLAGVARLSLTIEDDGPGFPKELLDHLGQRGFSTKSRSSGLGLWLTESAVVAAGGRLQLLPGSRGATVRILLRTLA